jgi:hypothetical protein
MRFLFRIVWLLAIVAMFLVGLGIALTGNVIGGCLLLAVVFCCVALDNIAENSRKSAAALVAAAARQKYRQPEAWPQPELPSDPLADRLAEENAMAVLGQRKKPLR